MSDSSDPSFLTSFQNKLVLQEEEEESSSGKVKKEDADWGKFHGVRKRPRGDFVAEIRNPDIHVWLGAYESPEEAAFAYDQGAYKLYGSRALLNFPYLIGAYSKPNGHIRSQTSPIV